MPIGVSPPARAPSSARDRVVVAVAAGAAVYALVLGWRLDYLGHFIAGAGVALVILPLLAPRWGTPAAALVTTAAAIAGSVVSEVWLFGGLFVDPIDITNLVLGAVVVAAAAIHEPPAELDRRWVAAGLACILAGLAFRFLVPFTLL